jgi:hypothetical protein
MQSSNRIALRIALKEWAIVVHALSEGSQILLLRKGGIAEPNGEFRLAAREFFLYPTWEHQQVELLQPRCAVAFQGHSPPAAGDLSFEQYAVVTDVWPAPSLSRIQQLSGEFVWNEAFLEKRYAYKPHLPLAVLAVRVYRLPHALRVALLDRYAGCRSWVELEEALPTEGAKPVLDDSAFERRREALREHLVAGAVAYYA